MVSPSSGNTAMPTLTEIARVICPVNVGLLGYSERAFFQFKGGRSELATRRR